MTDGHLHLRLGGMSVAGQNFLDLCGSIMVNGDFCLGSCQANGSASMSHQDRSFRVGVVGVKFLDGDTTWLKRLDDLTDSVINSVDSLGKIGSCCSDHAGFHDMQPFCRILQHPVPRNVQTGIDPQDGCLCCRCIHDDLPFPR